MKSNTNKANQYSNFLKKIPSIYWTSNLNDINCKFYYQIFIFQCMDATLSFQNVFFFFFFLHYHHVLVHYELVFGVHCEESLHCRTYHGYI